MRTYTMASLALAVALGLPLIACEDTKARQENEQLKARVSELEKENADLGSRVDALTKESAALQEENDRLKAKNAQAKRTPKARRHRRASKRAVSSHPGQAPDELRLVRDGDRAVFGR
jgi:regulator of replication initiation timing